MADLCRNLVGLSGEGRQAEHFQKRIVLSVNLDASIVCGFQIYFTCKIGASTDLSLDRVQKTHPAFSHYIGIVCDSHEANRDIPQSEQNPGGTSVVFSN